MTRGIRTAHLPRILFSELFLHLSLFIGFPVMLDGLEKLHALRPAKTRTGVIEPSIETLKKKGRRLLTRIYGAQTQRLLKNLNALHPELSERIVEDAYGRVLSRRGLTLQERELINVTVLSIQGYHRQLFSHIRGAQRVGVSYQKIKLTLRNVRTISNISIQEPLAILDEVRAAMGE